MRTNGLLLMFFFVQPEKDNIERFSVDMKKIEVFHVQAAFSYRSNRTEILR